MKREKNLAFSVSGGCYPYQMGIAYYIQKNFDLSNIKFSGASGGSWPACLLASGIDLKVALQYMFDFAAPICQNKTFGAYGIYDRGMRATFRELYKNMDVPSIVNGRLAIPVTRVALSGVVPYLKEELVTEFIDNDDIISAIIASSLIPFLITGAPVSIYRNWICVDAGLTNAAGVRRMHDILVDTMLVTGQSNPDFGLEGARVSRANNLPVTSEPYGVYNLTLMTVRTVATSVGHVIYNLAASPKMMDDASNSNNNQSLLTLSPRSYPPGYPHVQCGHTEEDSKQALRAGGEAALPFPYPNQPNDMPGAAASSAGAATAPSTEYPHTNNDDSMDVAKQSFVSNGDVDDSRLTADQSTTTCSSDEFSFLRVKANTAALGEEEESLKADDDIHNTSDILNATTYTEGTAMVGGLYDDDTVADIQVALEGSTLDDQRDVRAKDRLVSIGEPAARKESNASTTSTTSLGGGGLNSNKSFVSWVSDDFTASVHFDASKKRIYNCNPTPSKIDVESGSVLLLDQSAESGAQRQQSGGGSFLGSEGTTRRLSLLTPLYTCIDIVQYFLPSGPAQPDVLPRSNIPGSTDPTLARSMLQYVYRITEELRDSVVATPVTAIRSVGSLLSYVYTSPPAAVDVEGNNMSAQNVTEYPADSPAGIEANISSPNLHAPGAQFDHTVKVFDRSMYWTTKANLVTKTVKGGKAGQGADNATITGITMEIAPWTWRHHPLHHFHLSNDIKQLEYLFELGIHDAFVHHAEMAEFFNANLNDL